MWRIKYLYLTFIMICHSVIIRANIGVFLEDIARPIAPYPDAPLYFYLGMSPQIKIK